jgi:flagellar basal-body rod protein FlgC
VYGTLEISTSALVAQRTRMDVIAGNIANAFTTRRLDGEPGPYRRRFVVFEPTDPNATAGTGDRASAPGVHVSAIREDPSLLRYRLDPEHPDAIKEGPHAGYVAYPNVDLSVEMVDAIEAARAYEANITVMDVTKNMISSSLRLLA